MSSKNKDKLSLSGSINTINKKVLVSELEGNKLQETDQTTNQNFLPKDKKIDKRISGVPVYLHPKVRDALDVYIFNNRKEQIKPNINSILNEGLDLWFQKNHNCTLNDIIEGKIPFNI